MVAETAKKSLQQKQQMESASWGTIVLPLKMLPKCPSPNTYSQKKSNPKGKIPVDQVALECRDNTKRIGFRIWGSDFRIGFILGR